MTDKEIVNTEYFKKAKEYIKRLEEDRAKVRKENGDSD